jgi:uncharacterized protein DUF2516
VLALPAGVDAIGHVESWILLILHWSLLAVRVWALADCLVRKSAAFPAAGKLTKMAWVLITAMSVFIGWVWGILNLLSFLSLVATLVYLTDVRPSVREISGGSRW